MGGQSTDFIKHQMEFLASIAKDDEGFLVNNFEQLDMNYYDGLLPHPLNYAILSGSKLESVKTLVQCGADVNTQCILTGMTPLHYAAMKGRLDIVQFLYEEDALINVEDHINKRTPLHYAVGAGYTEVVRFLCQKGADVSMADMDGNTALHIAVENERTELITVLNFFGAKMNYQNKYDNQTPLHIGASKGNKDLITEMMKHGGNPYLPDRYGKTAIELARNNKNFMITQIMEEFEAKVFEGGQSIEESDIEEQDTKAVS